MNREAAAGGTQHGVTPALTRRSTLTRPRLASRADRYSGSSTRHLELRNTRRAVEPVAICPWISEAMSRAARSDSTLAPMVVAVLRGPPSRRPMTVAPRTTDEAIATIAEYR